MKDNVQSSNFFYEKYRDIKISLVVPETWELTTEFPILQGVRREVGKHSRALNKLSQTERPMNSSFPYKDEDLRVDSQLEKRISSSLNRNLEIGSPMLSEESTKALTVPSPVKQDVTSSSVANDLEEGSRMEASSSWKPFKESIGHTEIEVAAGALLGFTVSLITNSLL